MLDIVGVSFLDIGAVNIQEPGRIEAFLESYDNSGRRVPNVPRAERPRLYLSAPDPHLPVEGMPCWACYRGGLQVQSTGRNFRVETDTVAYYTSPPPDFWPFTFPVVSGYIVLTRIEPIIMGQDWSSAIPRDFILHIHRFSRAILGSRIAVNGRLWVSGCIFRVANDAIHILCDQMIPEAVPAQVS